MMHWPQSGSTAAFVLPAPHATTEPSAFSANVCASPAAMAVTLLCASGGASVSPYVFLPHPTTEPGDACPAVAPSQATKKRLQHCPEQKNKRRLAIRRAQRAECGTCF